MTTPAQFKKAVWQHYRAAGRHGLPWRGTRDPYAVLVSEVMLQQTQVVRVERFYGRFLAQFPDFKALAKADTAGVLRAWQGLGYNRRALALKKLAEIVVRDHGGRLPDTREALEKLPGIGRGTSGSLMAFAFNRPEPFIETNIRRVFIHFFFPHARKPVTDAAIERYIESTIDRKNPREWYWALMDYGAAMPAKGSGVRLAANPNTKSAHYKKQSAFKGSDREARGRIVRYLLAREKVREKGRSDGVPVGVIGKITDITEERLEKVLSRLSKEGFIIREGNRVRIKK